MFRVPQTTGHPGWIIFTYEENVPVCLWVSAVECKKVPCIVDERLCGDTFLKVERIGELDFVVSDIWMYNSNCVFACSTFKQRYDWLFKLLTKFTRCVEGVTIDLIHKMDLGDVQIRGHEYHPVDTPGCHGYFAQNDGTVFGSGSHDKTGRHCQATDPNGKLDIANDAGFWLRDENGELTKAFQHICWDGCMFPNDVMLKQQTWNDILAALIKVRDHHGWSN
jgi:hypothetical protein